MNLIRSYLSFTKPCCVKALCVSLGAEILNPLGSESKVSTGKWLTFMNLRIDSRFSPDLYSYDLALIVSCGWLGSGWV